ncbi:GNAT family N-acetyltransferase [Roseivivax sp.]
MPLRIAKVDPFSPPIAAVLRQSHALMQEMFPPEENAFLDLPGLAAPGVTLWAAFEREEGVASDGAALDGAEVLGTVALKVEDGAASAPERAGEVKSLFVSEAARGRGVGEALLAHLEAEAGAEGLTVLRLETGRGLDAARRLYERAGFSERGAFPPYVPNRSSLFFEKRLGGDDR